MITDLNPIESGTTIEADLCIVGGGAAAIAIARELIGSERVICVLESGGLGLETQAQALAGGTTSGIPYFPLDESRYRMLGGSTFRWGARGAPMVEIDFEPRPWLNQDGWPIRREELEPYYDRVAALADWRAPFDYDARVWDLFDTQPPAFDDKLFCFSAFQFGKIVLFGEQYRKLLDEAANLRFYLHAHVVNLQVNQSGDRVEYVDVQAANGNPHRVRAKYFVLAAGGIENPRLLLLSNTVHPTGLCNAGDLVGRFFMEHPTVSAGTVEAVDWQALHDVFSPGMIDGRLVETGLALSPALQRSRECLGAVVSTRLVADRDSTQALRELVWELRHHRLPGERAGWVRNPVLRERARTVFRDPLGVGANLLRHWMGKPKRFKIDSFYLEVRTEQEPNPESRVTLGAAKDALGQPRAHVHWELTERDLRTIQVAAETFDCELRRLGLGELRVAPWLEAGGRTFPADLVGGHHHMGTTRMSESSRTGVVDRDCRAHGIDNLYLAGSSVFPTAGYVNPTPTLLALSIRLADHLRARLG